MSTNELPTQQSVALAKLERAEVVIRTTDVTPMEMLKILVTQGADLDKITKFMDLQERVEKNEARKAYDKAFAAFKSECVEIKKTAKVTGGPLDGKKYADLSDVVNTTTPALSKYGLSSFWKLTKDEPNWIEVTCILRHELGHCETDSMGGPPDTGGAKNAIQARASTRSYLERYTYLSVTGQAACGEDNDGNGVKLTDELQDLLDIIKQSATVGELQAAYKEAYRSAKDTKTKAIYIDAYEARKKEL